MMTLTQALIERAHFAALSASAMWIKPDAFREKMRARKYLAWNACAVVLYDRAYDLAMGKDRK